MHIRRKNAALLAILLYTAIYYLWILLFNGSLEHRILVSNIIQTIPPIIVFPILLKAAMKAREGNRTFWLHLCVGCGSYLVSQLAWDYFEIVLGVYNPALTWQSAFWAISAISYIVGVSNKLNEKKEGNWTSVLIIDTLTVMCIAVSLTAVYVIVPGLHDLEGSSLVARLLYLAYPAVNLVSLFLSVNLYLSLKYNNPERKSLYLVSMAFFLMFAANSIYAFLSIADNYRSGSLMDPLWALYIMILGLAALEYIEAPASETSDTAERSEDSYHRSISFLPIASVILLFIFMIFSKSQIVTFFSSFSIVLITLRHALIILQNGQLISKLEQLNSNLEAKVNERTQELYELAFYDPLTGLPNRRMFEDALGKSLETVKRNGTSLALLFLDLDRFKTINDTLGHSYGDMLLQEVSRRIQRCLGAGYTISRQGGDEFAIIIEGYSNLQEVEKIAQQILSELLKPVDIANHFAYTTCSIGIALYSAVNSDVPTLMRHADAAMYRSKEIGKNTYQFYNPEMDVLITRKLTIERELRRAIENNEFTLYFQPQINTADNRIIGAEALIRWLHPERGIIPPVEFIPVAEETGMIELIGLWVMKNACIQAREWQEHGFEPIKVGVNISPYQLQQEHFVEIVERVLKETGLQPEYLDLEITEGLSIQNESDTIFKLHKLKRLGVRISIDDFGTGYSSLSYLNKLPINTLKIAQQFVRYIKNDTSSKAIVSAVIGIAKSLKLNIIAEGVENEYQLKFLKSQYCYEMQGYLFSKPVPAVEFEKLLREELQASVLR